MRILGTGSALPKRVVTNDELTQFLDTSDEWIKTRTGISTRRVITTETLEELGAQAAKNALENAGLSANDLDLIICSTVQGLSLIHICVLGLGQSDSVALQRKDLALFSKDLGNLKVL